MIKEIILNTKRDLASYHLNKEFSAMDFSLIQEMQKAELGYVEVQNPSEEYYFNELKDDFAKYDTLEQLKEDVDDYESFEELMQESKDGNYPMWNTIWGIQANRSDYYLENVDRLKEIGIGLLEFKEDYYLFIAGAGYDFYDAHWIPLFTKFFKWIEEDCGKEPTTITICKSEHAVFTGSKELQKFIESNLHIEQDAFHCSHFSLEDLKECKKPKDEKTRKELDLLIEELEDYNFTHLRIEY